MTPFEASSFVRTIEKRQGMKLTCPEEIAFKLGFISAAELEALARAHGSNGYGQYLRGLLEGLRLNPVCACEKR